MSKHISMVVSIFNPYKCSNLTCVSRLPKLGDDRACWSELSHGEMSHVQEASLHGLVFEQGLCELQSDSWIRAHIFAVLWERSEVQLRPLCGTTPMYVSSLPGLLLLNKVKNIYPYLHIVFFI